MSKRDLARFRAVEVDHIYDGIEEYYGIDRHTDERVLLTMKEAVEVHERAQLMLAVLVIEWERAGVKKKP